MECQKSKQVKIIVDTLNDVIKYSRCSFSKRQEIKGIQNFKFEELQKSNFSKEKLENYKNDCLEECSEDDIKIVDFNSFLGCNFKCFHCFTESHPIFQQNIDDTFFILNKLKNNNIDILALDGNGEIFLLYRQLCEFLKGLTPKDFKHIFFITNGSFLDSSKITELRETSEKTGIEYIFNLSIDGCTKETYESTRLGGNFEKVISVLGELKKYFTVKVTFTLKQTNLSDKDNIIQFFKQHSITGDNLIIGRDYFNSDLIEIQKNLEKKKYGLCE